MHEFNVKFKLQKLGDWGLKEKGSWTFPSCISFTAIYPFTGKKPPQYWGTKHLYYFVINKYSSIMFTGVDEG